MVVSPATLPVQGGRVFFGEEEMSAKQNKLLNLGMSPELATEVSRAAQFSSESVTSTPTDAELDSAFGQPADVGAGFIGVVDDNIVVSDGTNWRFVALTTAS